jgi:hypothetical protein
MSGLLELRAFWRPFSAWRVILSGELARGFTDLFASTGMRILIDWHTLE